MAALYEYLLTVNNFNKPTILGKQDAIYTLLIRLILLEPGTIQSHPNMGVGLVSRYRYSNSENLENLKSDIKDQIAIYLPSLTVNDVSVTESTQSITIQITVNNTVYSTVFDTTTKTLADL